MRFKELDPALCEALDRMNDCPDCQVRPAGARTQHPGYGKCRRCETKHDRELWMSVFEKAHRLDIDPWQALLETVKLTAGRLAWIDEHIANADDPELEIAWVRESRRERELLARASKAAIDGGVAERMVRNVESEVQTTVKAVVAGINALGLPEDKRREALEAAKESLLQSDGEIVDGIVLKVTEARKKKKEKKEIESG